MTLYYSNRIGNPKATNFPTKTDDLSIASKKDHVMCEYKGNERLEDNFVSCDCLYGDIDNSGTDIPEDWITQEIFTDMFHEFEWYTVTSRNNMKEKEGKAPRPKFHVYFPVERIEKIGTLKMWLKKLIQKYPFFDPAVKDGARFFFGNADGEIEHNVGKSILTDLFAVELQAKPPVKTRREEFTNLQEGDRHNNLFRSACKWVNSYPIEDVYVMLKQANELIPEPLSDKKIESIMKSVCKYADEQDVVKDQNGKKIIRNYRTERKVIKTENGERKIKVKKVTLDFTPEMDEPMPLFASL